VLQMLIFLGCSWILLRLLRPPEQCCGRHKPVRG